MKILAILLASVPAMAVAQDAMDRNALFTALAMNECAVAEDEAAAVFGAQGFDPDYARRELGEMVLDGTAFMQEGRILRVKADYCPPASPTPTPAQAFRQAIVENGCSIDDRQARALGIDVSRMRPVVQTWIEGGAAIVDWRTLRLTDCG